jgi:hypothetical protein
LLPSALYNNIQRTLHTMKSIQKDHLRDVSTPTPSSISKNATLRASFTASKASAPFVTSWKPLLPSPFSSHPPRPLTQGSENSSFGVCELSEGLYTMKRRSGKPSRFASPSLMGRGRAGVYVVSRTRRELVEEEGRRSERGIRTYA